MNWKFWKTKPQDDVLPLATSHEQIAGDICVQLGHLSESAKDEILKLVVSKTLKNKHVHANPRGRSMTQHWYQQTCKRNPKDCKQRRDESKPCLNPVCDCLLYERIQDDVRHDK